MRTNERGAAASVWIALLVLVLGLVIGITVDLTGQVNAQQRAVDIAQQAGRAAANQVQSAQAMQGRSPAIDIAAARTAAAAYLASTGVQGTVTVTGPQSLHVHVATTYQPRFLGTIGIGPRSVNGDTDVSLSRVVNGVQR